tara:strand:- start:9635 stop:10351 length:717 start_codon:yes stop_codon:yes gene_type:complete
MAINVNTVYQTVLSILNKESRGFLTPDEFKRIGAQVQLDILDRNFHDYNRAVIKQNAGRFVEGYGNIPEKIEEKIDPFFKQADITLTNGIGTLPTDLYKTINISVTNKTIQLEKVDKKNLSYLLSSPLTKPTTSHPVYYQRATDIIVEPALSDNSWTLGNLLIEYTKVPNDPVWNSSADANGALTYASSGSTDFTLHESDRVELIIGILKYAGLVISDPAVVQAASGEESKTIQLQNS